MACMSVFMQGANSQRPYPQHYIESAVATYLGTCRWALQILCRMEQKKLVSKTERVQYSPVIISAVKITYRMFLFLTTTKIRRANKMVLKFVEGSEWFRGRASDSTKRTLVEMLCCCVKTVHSTLLRFTQLYEWVPGSGEYVDKELSCINCSVAGCFPEKLRWCLIE